MTHLMPDYVGSVNLRCLPCGTRAPVLPTGSSLSRHGRQRQSRLGWCCPACAERLASGQFDADALMAERLRHAAERLAAILDQS